MLVTYSLQINACDILLKNIPREIAHTEMLVVYRVHNTNLKLAHSDVVGHKDVTFIMDIPPSELILPKVIMGISLYKVHPRGAKILLGKIEVDIKAFIMVAHRTKGDIVGIPGCYVLKTSDIQSVSLNSSIKLMIIDESELGYGDGEHNEPEEQGGSGGYTTPTCMAIRDAGDGNHRIEAIYRS